jgi:hypothetical protein
LLLCSLIIISEHKSKGFVIIPVSMRKSSRAVSNYNKNAGKKGVTDLVINK